MPTQQTLTSQVDLLANIPGILGFYPQEALVLAFFEHNDDTHSLQLGPLARLDLEGVIQQLTDDREKFAAWTGALNLDTVAAYVVTDDMVEADVVAYSSATSILRCAVKCWPLSTPRGITAGTAWCAMYLHPNSHEPPAVRISDIHASAALQQMLKKTGDLPALSC